MSYTFGGGELGLDGVVATDPGLLVGGGDEGGLGIFTPDPPSPSLALMPFAKVPTLPMTPWPILNAAIAFVGAASIAAAVTPPSPAAIDAKFPLTSA